MSERERADRSEVELLVSSLLLFVVFVDVFVKLAVARLFLYILLCGSCMLV